MKSLLDNALFQRMLGIGYVLFLTGMMIVSLPVMWVAERFLLPDDRPWFWNGGVRFNFWLAMTVFGIRLEYEGDIPSSREHVIFAPNHLSMMDGFFLLIFNGAQTVPLTAPFKSFPWPYSYWFKKSPAIQIRRNKLDDVHHPEALSKRVALEQMIERIREGANGLIFPEGHYGRTNTLHYIHSGVARIAIRARTKIQPVGLVNVEQVLISKTRIRPGVITIRFGKRVVPPELSRNYTYRHAVPELQAEVARRIKHLLPMRYLPAYEQQTVRQQQHTAAFFDIDRTIYKGYSQQDFVKYLMKHHDLSPWLAGRIAYWIVLEKLGYLPHEALMKRGYSVFAGWRVPDIQRLADAFFNSVVDDHIDTHIMPYIKDHQEMGHKIVLVTEVIHPLSRAFAKRLGADTCLDTQLAIDHGCYTGDVTLLNYRGNKRKQVQNYAVANHIDLNRCYAYADSAGDIPMLRCVKYPMAVNPNPILRQEAQKQHWPILS